MRPPERHLSNRGIQVGVSRQISRWQIVAMDGINRNPKQLQQTTARCFSRTLESVQPAPVANTTNPLAKARTTSPSRRRAQAVPNRYHRRERIGQRDHPGPGLRLPRPVLEGTVRGQRLGGAVTTRGAPNGRSTPGRHLGTQPPTPPRR